jgi:hypothetical protein
MNSFDLFQKNGDKGTQNWLISFQWQYDRISETGEKVVP